MSFAPERQFGRALSLTPTLPSIKCLLRRLFERSRPAVYPLALALAAAILGGAASGSASAAIPGVPSIYINYNPDCTFSMTVDPGVAITSSSPPGPTLPPGNYQLLVSMPNPDVGYACVTPTFTLTGPGVNSVTVFPMESVYADLPVVLQPSSTYVAEDTNAPAATEKVFTTSATGSSSALIPTKPTTTVAGSGSESSQPDLLGSALAPYRGSLQATVSAGGAATLDRDGRSVGALSAGRYELHVNDRSRRAGFFLERSNQKPLAVTGALYLGSRTESITLTAGSWSFYSNPAKQTRFTVAG